MTFYDLLSVFAVWLKISICFNSHTTLLAQMKLRSPAFIGASTKPVLSQSVTDSFDCQCRILHVLLLHLTLLALDFYIICGILYSILGKLASLYSNFHSGI
jgi:hypothetical protein